MAHFSLVHSGGFTSILYVSLMILMCFFKLFFSHASQSAEMFAWHDSPKSNSWGQINSGRSKSESPAKVYQSINVEAMQCQAYSEGRFPSYTWDLFVPKKTYIHHRYGGFSRYQEYRSLNPRIQQLWEKTPGKMTWATKKTLFRVYRGWHTTQLYGDYFTHH